MPTSSPTVYLNAVFRWDAGTHTCVAVTDSAVFRNGCMRQRCIGINVDYDFRLAGRCWASAITKRRMNTLNSALQDFRTEIREEPFFCTYIEIYTGFVYNMRRCAITQNGGMRSMNKNEQRKTTLNVSFSIDDKELLRMYALECDMTVATLIERVCK